MRHRSSQFDASGLRPACGHNARTVSELLAFRAEGAPKGATLNAKVAAEPA
jgi:hypothetical protein